MKFANKVRQRGISRSPVHLAAYFVLSIQLLYCGPTLAATQGAVAAASNASVAVSASVPARARISGLTDIALLNVNPTTNAIATRNLCAWSNTASKSYRITASGSGTANAFTLSNGGLSIPYTVQWNQASGQASGTGLVSGAASTTFASLATHQQCLSGPATSASLIVSVAAADLQSMRANTTYTGTLTLLMTPQ